MSELAIQEELMRLYYVPGESDQPPCSQGYGLLEYAAELQHSASSGACHLRDSIWRWALSDSAASSAAVSSAAASVVVGRGDARGQAYPGAGTGAVGSRASMRETQQGAGTSTTTGDAAAGEVTEGVTTITKLQFLERELELLRTAMAQAQAEEMEPPRDASAVAATATAAAAVAATVPSAVLSAVPSAAPIAISFTRSTAADAASMHTPVHDKARRPSMVDLVQQAASSVQLRRVSTNRQVSYRVITIIHQSQLVRTCLAVRPRGIVNAPPPRRVLTLPRRVLTSPLLAVP